MSSRINIVRIIDYLNLLSKLGKCKKSNPSFILNSFIKLYNLNAFL